MSKKTRNGYIDLLRFVAACIIMYFHFEIAPFIRPDGTPGSFPSGGLFVEFFFMLSGYFAISSFYMSDGKLHIGKYMLKKYVRFLPYTFFAVTFTYVWILICSNPSLFEAAKTLCMLPFEALLMRNTGINRVGHNGVLWYLSAMLITMPIILYTARRFPTVFKEYLVWVLPLCFYGYVLSRYGTIRTTHWQISNIRALAGMLLGCNIYFIVHAVENIRFSSRGKTILTVLELGLFGLILLFCMVRSFSKTYLDAFCVLLMYLFTIVALSGKSWTSKIQGRFFTYLGKISFPLYCVHYGYIDVVNKYFSGYRTRYRLLIFTGLVLATAIAVQFLVDYVVFPAMKRIAQKYHSLPRVS